MARAFAREASQITGQQWVVVNRAGGAGIVGFTALANANPDGHTVAFSPASALTNSPFLVKNMPFKPEQIEPVCQLFENVFASRSETHTRPRVGVVIGDQISDISAGFARGLFQGPACEAAMACGGDSLNELMALGPEK
jgi:hypothetical protein